MKYTAILRQILFMISSLPILIISCDLELRPLDDSILNKKTDINSPVITVLSPENNSPYASTVLVSGVISDSAADGESPGQIDTFRYSILGTAVEESIDIQDDGSFSFSFETNHLSGNISVLLEAADSNGNESTSTLLLTSEGALAGFSVVPGNRSVEISWNDVALVTSYNLFESTTTQTWTNVTSPIVIEDLVNGNDYQFQIQAVTSDGGFNWSDTRTVIPLSRKTLVPETSGVNSGVSLNWKDIPGAEKYKVLRSSDPNGAFSVVGLTSSHKFIDYGVKDGDIAYYCIQPGIDGSVISEPVSGASSPFVSGRDSYVTKLREDDASSSIIHKGYLYVLNDITEGTLNIYNLAEPEAPAKVATVSLRDHSGLSSFRRGELIAEGDYLYIIRYGIPNPDEDKIFMIDIAEPGNPHFLRFEESELYDWDCSIRQIGILDGYLAMLIFDDASDTSRISFSDITDPLNPEYREDLDFGISGNPNYFTIEGKTLCLAADDEVTIIDFSDISTPVINTISYTNPNFAHYLNGYIYVFDTDSMVTYEENDLNNPVSQLSLPGTVSSILGNDSYISDKTLYYSSEIGLLQFNIKNPASPLLEGQFDADTDIGSSCAFDGYQYLMAGELGLEVHKSGFPELPVIDDLNALPVLSSAGVVDWDVDEGVIALLNKNNFDLHIFQIGNHTVSSETVVELEISALLGGGAQAGSVDIHGSTIYVGVVTGIADSPEDGLYVIDINDPLNPILSNFIPYENIKDITSFGESIVLQTDYQRFDICSFEANGSLEYKGTFESSLMYMTKIELSGETLYCGQPYYATSPGMFVFDLSNPENPEETGFYDTQASKAESGRVDDFAIAENYIYLLEAGAGVKDFSVIDRTSEGDISRVASIDLSLMNSFSRIVYDNGYCYISGQINGNNGLAIVNVADPLNPVLSDYLEQDDDYSVSGISGGKLFMTSWSGGLKCLQL